MPEYVAGRLGQSAADIVNPNVATVMIKGGGKKGKIRKIKIVTSVASRYCVATEATTEGLRNAVYTKTDMPMFSHDSHTGLQAQLSQSYII